MPELRAQLKAALPTPLETNSDGTSYVATVARYQEKVHNPMSAIRAKCVECSGGSLKEVGECRVKTCALHPFRMGVNPYHKKTGKKLGFNPFNKQDSKE